MSYLQPQEPAVSASERWPMLSFASNNCVLCLSFHLKQSRRVQSLVVAAAWRLRVYFSLALEKGHLTSGERLFLPVDWRQRSSFDWTEQSFAFKIKAYETFKDKYINATRQVCSFPLIGPFVSKKHVLLIFKYVQPCTKISKRVDFLQIHLLKH